MNNGEWKWGTKFGKFFPGWVLAFWGELEYTNRKLERTNLQYWRDLHDVGSTGRRE